MIETSKVIQKGEMDFKTVINSNVPIVLTPSPRSLVNYTRDQKLTSSVANNPATFFLIKVSLPLPE